MNDLQFRITALDNFTKTMKKFNDSVERTTRPITVIGKQFKDLNKEFQRNPLVKGFNAVGKSVTAVAKGMAKLAEPLLAVTGGASIVGLGVMVDKWGQFGMQVDRVSRTLGLSSGEVQRWRGAARLAGVDAATMDSALESLGDTAENALAGRDKNAMALANALHIEIQRDANGAIKLKKLFLDISDAMTGFDGKPEMQRVIANSFGIGSLVPLLLKGHKEIEEFMDKIDKLGGSGQKGNESMTELGRSVTELKLALEGMGVSVAEGITPKLKPIIDLTTQWVSQNHDLVTTGINYFIDGYTKSIDKLSGAFESLSGSMSFLPAAMKFSNSVWSLNPMTALPVNGAQAIWDHYHDPASLGPRSSSGLVGYPGGAPTLTTPFSTFHTNSSGWKSVTDEFRDQVYNNPNSKADRLAIMNNELANPGNSAADIAKLQREISAVQKDQRIVLDVNIRGGMATVRNNNSNTDLRITHTDLLGANP